MSPLNDLHQKLYNKNNDDLAKRKYSPDKYDIEKNLKNENIEFDKDPIDNQLEKTHSGIETAVISKIDNNKIKIILGIFGIIFLIIGAIIGFVRYKQSAFNQENVIVEFQGDNFVRSGEDLNYKLLIHNNNRVALKNTQIKIEYPEELTLVAMNFIKMSTLKSFYIEVGDMKPNETKDYQLKFNVFSPRGNQIYLNTNFRYEPSNFSSVFNNEANHSVDINGAVVDISLVSQQEATSGELLKMILSLTNNTANDLNDLILGMEYPEDFSLEQLGLVKTAGNKNKFKIPELKANSKLEIELLGNFKGSVDSIKKIIGMIGRLDDDGDFLEISLAEETIKVIPSRIVITQDLIKDVNQGIYLGNILKYKINFKNNSSNPLGDLILKEKIKTDLINHASVIARAGYYDQEKQEILWKASDVPALKNLNPGESGSVEFEFKLKDSFNPEKDKTNQLISTQVNVSSLNINTSLPGGKEIYSENKELKINTNLDVSIYGEFTGDVFRNYGPIPLQVKEETTFTIKIALKNNFNKIDKPNLTITLPSGINWKNSFQRSSGTVTFNERTNELMWKLNSLNSQIGYEYPTEELIFQIGVKLQPNQIGHDVILVNSIKFKGFEHFVEKDIEMNMGEFKLSSIKDYAF